MDNGNKISYNMLLDLYVLYAHRSLRTREKDDEPYDDKIINEMRDFMLEHWDYEL